MDLRLTGEQEQLVDAFSALYAKHAPSERVREAEPLGFDEGLWTRLQEVGVVAMAVAEDAGGWGASTLDLTLVADIYISAPTPGGARAVATLDPYAPERVAAVPGVLEIEAIRGVIVDSEFGPVQLSATDTQRRRSATRSHAASTMTSTPTIQPTCRWPCSIR